MLSERMNLALKAVLGLAPVCYSAILIASLPDTRQWAILVAVVLVTLLVLVGWLDLPLQTIWPVFPSALLILAGTLAFYLDAPTLGLMDTSPGGLLMLYFVAACYLIWGARATWKAAHIY